MNKKNIKENNAATGGVAFATKALSKEARKAGGHPFVKEVSRRNSKNPTAPFATVDETTVKMPISRKGVVVSGKGKKKKLTAAKMYESKGESMLREAIRNLVFLNRVKYHEEQVKREIEEQKVRKIIRYLLRENKDPILPTTGENNAQEFVRNIQSTTFDQKYARLASDKQQRQSFKEVYLRKLKLYLDSLDQQYILIHPEDKPQNYKPEAPSEGNSTSTGQAPNNSTAPTAPDMGAATTPPAKRSELKEFSDPNAVRPPDTSRIQQQVLATNINTPNIHPSGVLQANDALKKDMPQIDSLYSMLTFRPLQKGSKTTSDRELFRNMLFGGVDETGATYPGNLDNAFKFIDDSAPTSDQPGAEIPKPDNTMTAPAAPAAPADQALDSAQPETTEKPEQDLEGT